MKILGISGKKQSGKDTLGSYIGVSGLYGHTFETWFATAGKKLLHIGLGVPHELLWGSNEQKDRKTHIRWRDLPHFERYIYQAEVGNQRAIEVLHKADEYLTGRQAMQEYMENVFDKTPGTWVRYWKHEINELRKISQSTDVVVVSDVRRPDEIDAIHEEGGKVIRLLRAPCEDKFSSENHLNPENYDPSNFDVVIDNRAMSVGETRREATRILDSWGWRI